jgi:hypothetical protein
VARQVWCRYGATDLREDLRIEKREPADIRFVPGGKDDVISGKDLVLFLATFEPQIDFITRLDLSDVSA